MPSKALLRPVELANEARRVPGARGAVSPIDAEAVLKRRDEVIHDLDDSAQLPWLEERGVDARPRPRPARREAAGATSRGRRR